MEGVFRLGVLPAPVHKMYALESYNGTTIYGYFANEIRFFFEALQLSYYAIPVPDGKLGVKEADGNWSGLIGMAARSEVDLVMCPLSTVSQVPENVHFSYPHGITDLTFMTNKPEPVSMSLAIVHPFPYSMWIALAVILIAIPTLFYILMNKELKYQTILFNVFGNLLEQSLTFEVRRNSARILFTGWLLGVMIISYGYKAVLLSSLSIPHTTVICDIAELGRASVEGSVTCFMYPGSDLRFFTLSEIESFRDIGSCLKRRKDFIYTDFYNLKSKRVFISSRRGLSFDENDFYISTDSFDFQLYSFLLLKNFCCTEKFNRLINQLRAVGLQKKFDEEEKFFLKSYTKTISTEASAPSTPSTKILMSDISGAFIILIFGWVFAFLTFIGEILMEKYVARGK